MTILKHNARTLRDKPAPGSNIRPPRECKRCGEVGFYWAHDTSIYNPACNECGVSGKFVMVNANAETKAVAVGGEIDPRHIHNLTCTGIKPVPAATPEPAPVPAAEPHAEPVPAAFGPVTPEPSPMPSASSTDLFAGFLTAVRDEVAAGLSNTVDAAQVEAIVKAEIAKQSTPNVTTFGNALTGTQVNVTNHHAVLPDVVKLLSIGLNVMMVGPAGTGKSHIARQAAEALGLPFYSIACHPLMTDVKLFGFTDAHGVFHDTPLYRAWVNGGLFLVDEGDNCHSSFFPALNEALAAGEATFGNGETLKAHPDFRCAAGANTYGNGADKRYKRQPIDASTIDRFFFLSVGYDEAMEEGMCLASGLDAGKVKDVLRYARKLRRNALSKDMRAVVSVRGTSSVCRILAAGIMDWDAAFEGSVFKGMTPEDRITIGA